MLIIRDYGILNIRPIDYVDILLVFVNSFLYFIKIIQMRSNFEIVSPLFIFLK